MTSGSKRLILHGFYNDKWKEEHPDWDAKDSEGRPKYSKEKKDEILKALKESDAEKFADHDSLEIQRDQVMTMNYPKPKNKYHVIYEVPHESIEPIYFWFMKNIQYDLGYPVIHKISDIFTAAEHSSFYGAAAQRLGLAQDKVAQYMATIGRMIKDMFQLVRELRWIDERKRYYIDSDQKTGWEPAEVALKGLWTDMVDGVVGGQRTSSNLFVMAQQLQFASLPDLFFSMHVNKAVVAKLKGKEIKDVKDEEVRNAVESIVDKQAAGFNKEVRNILKRKLYQFLVWKIETWTEIQQRRKFTLDYLRQHYQSIKMYITWVKPYLKHIQRLGADVSKLSSADLVSAFEGSLIEIEILAQKVPEGNKDVFSCLLITFQYRARPQMQFTDQSIGYHRGPIHVGESKIFWRAYTWTEKQIEEFKQMKDDEDMELVKNIDDSLRAAMEALGDDLKEYLKEAEEQHKEKKEEKPVKRPVDILSPFRDIGKGFGETFGAIVPKKKKGGPDKAKKEKETSAASKSAKGDLWNCYKLFKKNYRLLSW